MLQGTLALGPRASAVVPPPLLCEASWSGDGGGTLSQYELAQKLYGDPGELANARNTVVRLRKQLPDP